MLLRNPQAMVTFAAQCSCVSHVPSDVVTFVIFARLNIRHLSIKTIAAIFLAGHIDAGETATNIAYVCWSTA